MSGSGVVIHCHQGMVQATSRGYFARIQDPEVVEAMAVCQALFVAQESSMRKIEMASDCLLLINKMKEQKLYRYTT